MKNIENVYILVLTIITGLQRLDASDVQFKDKGRDLSGYPVILYNRRVDLFDHNVGVFLGM